MRQPLYPCKLVCLGSQRCSRLRVQAPKLGEPLEIWISFDGSESLAGLLLLAGAQLGDAQQKLRVRRISNSRLGQPSFDGIDGFVVLPVTQVGKPDADVLGSQRVSGSFCRRLGKQNLIGCCLFAGRLEQAGIRIEATTVGKDIVPDALLENALSRAPTLSGFGRDSNSSGQELSAAD
jgi:hypothetical protein